MISLDNIMFTNACDHYDDTNTQKQPPPIKRNTSWSQQGRVIPPAATVFLLILTAIAKKSTMVVAAAQNSLQPMTAFVVSSPTFIKRKRPISTTATIPLYYSNQNDDLPSASLIEGGDEEKIEMNNVQSSNEITASESNNKNEGNKDGMITATETQLDYVGAGTLGDIMSLPDDDKKVNGTSSLTTRRSTDLSDEMGSTIAMKTTQKQNDTLSSATTHWTSNLTDSTHFSSTSSKSELKDSPTKSGLVTSIGGTLSKRFRSKIPNLSPLDRIALTANGNLQRIFSSYYDAPVFVHVDLCFIRQKEEPSFLLSREMKKKYESNDGAADGKGRSSVADETMNKDLNSEYSSFRNMNGKGVTNGGGGGGGTNGEDNVVPTVWDRVVHLSVHDQRFCTATSVITVDSPKCVQLVESGKVGIGQLFRYLDKLPTFELLDAGRTEDGGLWRRYELSCAELTCDIKEVFVPNAWEIDC